MELNIDEYEDIMYGGQFEELGVAEIFEQSRWRTYFKQVLKKDDGTFWQVTWARGSTELQDEGPEDIEMEEVVPVEKTIIVYQYKNKGE